jgi:hypothetical protein
VPQDGKLPVEEGYQNRVAAPASAATEGRKILTEHIEELCRTENTFNIFRQKQINNAIINWK